MGGDMDRCVMDMDRVAAGSGAECGDDDVRTFRMTLDIDPASLSTAQQKRYNPRTGRFFRSRRVARGMAEVTRLARAGTDGARAALKGAHGVELGMAFLYAWPKSAPRSARGECVPMPTGADCDNRAKAPIDALADAGWWGDDREITRLVVAKMRTDGRPRIVVAVRAARRGTFPESYLF